MKTNSESALVIPPALLAEVQTAAREEHRAPSELVNDGLRRYLQSRRPLAAPAAVDQKAPAAIERIRELRKGNFLSEGITIRDLISEGRA